MLRHSIRRGPAVVLVLAAVACGAPGDGARPDAAVAGDAPPTVAIRAPADGAFVHGVVSVTVPLVPVPSNPS